MSNSVAEEKIVVGLSALRNSRKSTKDNTIGIASNPIHMVAREGGNIKDQLWRTFRFIVVSFFMISGVGALIEDKGISKGIPC